MSHPPQLPPEDVLAEGLLAQIPEITEQQARDVAAALAFDLRAAGHLPAAPVSA
jgi:hypothetical protein